MKAAVVIFGLMLSAGVIQAKYKYPEGATTTTERRVNRAIRNYDADQDGGLSLEEFQEKRKLRTRDDRRMERRARKNGTYLSPEEQFKLMDKDGDGNVTNEEMLEYERSLQQKT